MSLQVFWFCALVFLLAGYAVLDGFDLGVGILHLFTPDHRERRVFMNAIGPVWDGNEVWLVTFGGALFAAFPEAYATAFSAFYLPFMALLFALIIRAVSLEFRGKLDSARWRRSWDAAFCLASGLAALLLGVAAGDLMLGLPIGANREFAGGLADLLRPYALLVGFLTVALFALHGAIYLHLKAEGDLCARLRRWMWRAFAVFVLLYVPAMTLTLLWVPAAGSGSALPLRAAALASALAAVSVARALYLRRPGLAFVSSSLLVASFVVLFGVAMFPNLIPSSLEPAWSLTIANSASSEKTLLIMRRIAFLGMPLVLGYTAFIHWTFRGKVSLDESSY